MTVGWYRIGYVMCSIFKSKSVVQSSLHSVCQAEVAAEAGASTTTPDLIANASVAASV